MHAIAPRRLCAAVIALAIATVAGADPVALTGVRIVDVDAGRILDGRTIIIDGDRIVAVHEGRSQLPEGAIVIDGAGRYALPGLIDSHVHYAAPDVYDPLMIAHGVALVREMGGETESMILLRDERENGSRKGPRMRVTGAIVDGVPPYWPFSEAVDTPEAGRAAVRRLREAGVDFIKVYQGLKPEVHEAVCDEAQRLGLMPLGHVPSSLTVEEAIAHGQRTIEHLTGVDSMLHRHNHPDGDPNPDFMTAMRAWSESTTLDDAEIARLAAPIADARVAHCPTLAVFDGVRSFAAGDDRYDRFHPAMMKSFWGAGPYEQWGKAIDAQMPTILRFAGALHDAGAPVIAGTDLANPGVVAGVGLHREMELLVEAGLTPLEAIRAATTTPASFFGLDDLGAIAPGKEATLLLLNADPLANIDATREIHTVVHRGDVYDRAALDRLLEEAASAASSEPALAGEPDLADLAEFNLPGALVASGVYKYSFGAFDAGREIFRITRDGGGYNIAAFARFNGGPTPPSVTTLRADLAHRFVSGAYRLVGRDAPPARYALADGKATATAGDETQTIDAPAGAIIAGPAAATDFASLQALDLEVGESATPPYIGFGNPSWRMNAVENTVTRLENGEVTLPNGRRIATSVYQQTISIPGMGEMRITTHLDGAGVVVASVMKLPMGELSVELEEYVTPE